MNAPIPPASVDCYAAKLEEAFLWRSACMQQFAQFEMCVGNTLDVLLRTKKPGTRMTNAHQIRAAVEELRRITAPKGAFAKPGKSIGASLGVIEPMLDWRNHLSHGVLDVWHGRKGQWLITLHHREKDCSGPVRWHAMPFADADAWGEQLRVEVGKFEQRCDALTRHLSKPAA